jgi:ribosomal protein S18 acetylase RimI-like enzyme
MIHVIPCQDRFEELVQFITRLNSDTSHHIGYFGEGDADVRSALAECLTPPADGFMMAYENQLVGIFGVDITPEINRAWLFGPLVEHEDWHVVADQLYQAVLPLVPANIRDRDLFCDVQNIHIEEFARRYGFLLQSENAVMTLLRENYSPSAKRSFEVIPYQVRFFDQFEKLHKILFPNAYFTAQQMAAQRDPNHQLFLAFENEVLLGFIFCKVEPESKSGYVDFIGTDVSARGRGIAADLLASGVDWMLSAPSTGKISLTVHVDNIPARNLYEKFGFTIEHVMRGYRKQVF